MAVCLRQISYAIPPWLKFSLQLTQRPNVNKFIRDLVSTSSENYSIRYVPSYYKGRWGYSWRLFCYGIWG